MKDDLAFRQSKRLGHTRAHFNLMTALAEWAISDAGGKNAVFGVKPGVAEYTPTDLGVEAGKAVRSNTANYEDIAAYLEKQFPGWAEMVKSGSRNTQSMLRGEIPQDVQDSIKRSSAYRSLQGGFAGSGMSKALTVRDFGKTSLDLIEAGGNAAQRWMGITGGAAAPFLVTAPAQGEATFKNNLYKQAVEQFKLNVAAAPDPGAAGQFNLQTALGSQAMSFGMGSAMGAGGVSGGGQRSSGFGTGAQAAGNNAYPYNWWGTGSSLGGG